MRRRAAVLGVICIPIALSLLYLRDFYHDDAFISLRYARNLVEGHGLVWNPGEPPVEGYTNFLWVILSAALHFLRVDLIDATRVLGVLSLIGLLAVVLWMAPRAAALPAAVLLATNLTLAAWAWGGLETVGFTLFLTAGVLLLQSLDDRSTPLRSLAAGVVLALAQLLRPEAILVLCLWIGQSLLLPGRTKTGSSMRTIVLVTLPFLLMVGGHLAWRAAYYGEWLPNSYYVKSSGFSPEFARQGIHYLRQFAVFDAVAVTLFALAVAGALRHRERRAVLTVGTVLVYLFYVVWSGGDHMQWFRFLVPVTPLLYLTAAGFVFERLKAPRFLPWALVAAASIYHLISGAVYGERGWKRMDMAARHGTIVGMHIRRNWPEESVVALNTAGSTAFYAGVRCIDMLGINDRHIARTAARYDPRLPWTGKAGHRKGDGRYVLGRKPDYIILGGSEGYAFPWFHSDREIMESPEFRRNYDLRRVVLSEGPGGRAFRFTYFQRR